MSATVSKSQKRRISAQAKVKENGTAPTKRLFMLRDPAGHIIKEEYYNSKKQAKAVRSFLNGFHLDPDGNKRENKGYTITVGPDHRRWKG